MRRCPSQIFVHGQNVTAKTISVLYAWKIRKICVPKNLDSEIAAKLR